MGSSMKQLADPLPEALLGHGEAHGLGGHVVGPGADREALDVRIRLGRVDEQFPPTRTEAEPRQSQRLDGIEERRHPFCQRQVGDVHADRRCWFHSVAEGWRHGQRRVPARSLDWDTGRGAGSPGQRESMSAAAPPNAHWIPARSAAAPQRSAPTAWHPWKANRMSAMIRGLTQSGSAWWAAVIQVVCTPTHDAPPRTSRPATTQTSERVRGRAAWPRTSASRRSRTG